MKTLPGHLFVSWGGDLFDTRHPDWSRRPLRARYRFTFSRIDTAREAASTLRAGRFDPGGYPLLLVTDDAEALCFKCARKEWRQIVWAMLTKSNNGWRIIGCDVNEEGEQVRCCHCGESII